MSNTRQFSMRLEDETRHELETLAAAEGRSLGNLIKRALREWLQLKRKAAERRK